MGAVEVVVLGLALSMDAFAASVIGVMTAACCVVGLVIGRRLGHLLGDDAELPWGHPAHLHWHAGISGTLIVMQPEPRPSPSHDAEEDGCTEARTAPMTSDAMPYT